MTNKERAALINFKAHRSGEYDRKLETTRPERRRVVLERMRKRSRKDPLFGDPMGRQLTDSIDVSGS